MNESIDMVLAKGYRLNTSGSDTTGKKFYELDPEANPTEEVIHFVLVSPKEAGLKPNWTRREFFGLMLDQGLELCFGYDIFEIINQDGVGLQKYESLSSAMRTLNEAVFNISNRTYREDDKINWFGMSYNGLDGKFDYPEHINDKYIFRIAKGHTAL